MNERAIRRIAAILGALPLAALVWVLVAMQSQLDLAAAAEAVETAALAVHASVAPDEACTGSLRGYSECDPGGLAAALLASAAGLRGVADDPAVARALDGGLHARVARFGADRPSGAASVRQARELSAAAALLAADARADERDALGRLARTLVLLLVFSAGATIAASSLRSFSSRSPRRGRWPVRGQAASPRAEPDLLHRQSSAVVRLASSPAVAAGDLDVASREIVEAAIELLDVDRVGFWLLDEGRCRLDCRAIVMDGQAIEHRQADPGVDRQAEWLRSLEREKVLVRPAGPGHASGPSGWRDTGEPRNWVDASIRIGHAAVGVLTLSRPAAGAAWSAADRSVAGSLADVAALAVAAHYRSRAELALRAEQESYRVLFESISDPVFIFERDSMRYLDCNAAVQRVYGYAKDELLAMTPFDITPAEEHGWLTNNVDDSMSGRPLPFTHRTSTGRTIPVEVVTEAMEYRGRPAWVSIARDVTERQRAMAAIRSQEEYLRRVIDAAPNPMFARDERGRFTLANLAFGQLCGTPVAELVGRTPHAIRKPEADVSALFANESEVRDDGAPVLRAEERVTDASGSRRWFQLLKVPLRSKWRTGGQVLTVATDITALKETERELERTRGEALSAARAKSLFVANMSHEIRTPLNGVIGMADLLSMTELDDDQRESVDIIRASGKDLLELLNTILDFSKIEAGRLELESIEFDPRELLGGVERVVGPRAAGRGLRLTAEVSNEVPERAIGDPVRLKQVLLNLAGNAVKFTESGSITLSCSVLAAQGQAESLRYEVRDTGVGIPPEKQRAIFEAFSQADGSTTRRFGGTGLGLTISTQLVRMMGGRIEVSSEPGKGSAFSFAIPCVRPESGARESDGPGADEAAQRVAAADRRRLRVLVVEDNAVNRKLAVTLLTRAGHEVLESTNGQEAVDTFSQETSLDAVLMDVQMPEMDGLEASRRIRSIEAKRGGHVWIVALTAHALHGDRERCLLAGMDAYLSKPVEAIQLLRVLEGRGLDPAAVLVGAGSAGRDGS